MKFKTYVFDHCDMDFKKLCCAENCSGKCERKGVKKMADRENLAKELGMPVSDVESLEGAMQNLKLSDTGDEVYAPRPERSYNPASVRATENDAKQLAGKDGKVWSDLHEDKRQGYIAEAIVKNSKETAV